ncbi:MAG: hypothetical protein OXR07_08165 [Nitrospira sp.]|nr:hypothetical protein [Nitrospira sp.]
MVKSRPRKNPPPSPASRRDDSFLPPQATETVWAHLPLLLLVAFVLRATVALTGDFLLHPDEVMQYLEPAHRLVFGNGVVFWEYFYGARSWIMPGLIAAILWLCTLTGLDSPQAYITVIKLVFCALSLAIPLGMYLFCRRHWGERSARLALVFGVFWYELVAFAHKPMTEFVATGLMCVLLAVLPLHAPARHWRGWAVAGALGALTIAVRFQYAPMIGVILLAGGFRARLTGMPLLAVARGWLAMIGGGAVVVGAIGALETWTWGMPFHSYWVNTMFNLEANRARGGESTLWLLPWQLLHASCGLVAVTVVSLVWNVRRRGFVVVLLLSVLIPHLLSSHREYRFIFATVPLWLMLFADVMAVASARFLHAGAWMRRAGVGAVALVSVAGLANAIPDQNSIYKGFSSEGSSVSFLRDRDPGLQLYRRLSEDDTVRGVMDASQLYPTCGGYYYLHHAVPLYNLSLWKRLADPDSDPARYVSHIITRASPGGGTLVNAQDPVTGERFRALDTDHGYEWLPSFIGDSDSGELVYWNTHAVRQPQPAYTRVAQVGDLILWHHRTAPPPRPWRDYAIFVPPGSYITKTLQAILGAQRFRAWPLHYGIDLTPAPGSDQGDD